MDRQAIYIEMYKEWRTHVRHHETQRSTIMTVCSGLAGAIVAYIVSTYKPGALTLLAPSTFLIALGVAALLLSQKHYERTRRALEIAAAYQDAIDGLRTPIVSPATSQQIVSVFGEDPNTPTLAYLIKTAEERHRKNFPFLFESVRLHLLWNCFFAIVSLIGIAFTCVALYGHHLLPAA